MPGNPLVRFDEGRVGRSVRGRPLSYSTAARSPTCDGTPFPPLTSGVAFTPPAAPPPLGEVAPISLQAGVSAGHRGTDQRGGLRAGYSGTPRSSNRGTVVCALPQNVDECARINAVEFATPRTSPIASLGLGRLRRQP
jgi:hypothetical protein